MTKAAPPGRALEHLLLRVDAHPLWPDIAQAMDAVGGELERIHRQGSTPATTLTCSAATHAAGRRPGRADVVPQRPLCRRRSRWNDVVLEEIAMRDDDPEDALADMFLAALFGDRSVAR